MITYPAMLDVPEELVGFVAALLRGHRRELGTRKLTCWFQALFALVWFRKREDVRLLGRGFGLPQATGYRYLDEVVMVLAAQAPDLREALRRATATGWPT